MFAALVPSGSGPPRRPEPSSTWWSTPTSGTRQAATWVDSRRGFEFALLTHAVTMPPTLAAAKGPRVQTKGEDYAQARVSSVRDGVDVDGGRARGRRARQRLDGHRRQPAEPVRSEQAERTGHGDRREQPEHR